MAGNRKTRYVCSRRLCPKELSVGGRQKNQLLKMEDEHHRGVAVFHFCLGKKKGKRGIWGNIQRNKLLQKLFPVQKCIVMS